MRIRVSTDIDWTPRAQQVAGIFDIEQEPASTCEWDVVLPISEKPWNIGLITGPSGSGKSTIARELLSGPGFLWPENLKNWPKTRPIVEGFPEDMATKEICAILSSVGFSSPPAWLRPFHVLSTGQQFRCELARLLAYARQAAEGQVVVMDEFSSVVDRTVAKIGSAALAKTVRQRALQFVAITCHEDVIEWLQPDWILHTGSEPPTFAWRSLQQRPTIELELVRTTLQAWPLFRTHHYLSAELSSSSTCFIAFAQLAGHPQVPAAFSSWVNIIGHRGGKREHRTVVLPDFQGVGVGMSVSSTLASMWKALGYPAKSTTTHPAFVQSRQRSPLWKMTRGPSLTAHMGANARNRKLARQFGHCRTRMTAGFEYVGPAMDTEQAIRLLSA